MSTWCDVPASRRIRDDESGLVDGATTRGRPVSVRPEGPDWRPVCPLLRDGYGPATSTWREAVGGRIERETASLRAAGGCVVELR